MQYPSSTLSDAANLLTPGVSAFPVVSVLPALSIFPVVSVPSDVSALPALSLEYTCIALTFFILLLPAPNAVYIIAVIAVTHNNTHITIETITFLCFQLIPMSAPFTFPLLLYSFYCVLYTLIKLFYSKISFNPSDNN